MKNSDMETCKTKTRDNQSSIESIHESKSSISNSQMNKLPQGQNSFPEPSDGVIDKDTDLHFQWMRIDPTEVLHSISVYSSTHERDENRKIENGPFDIPIEVTDLFEPSLLSEWVQRIESNDIYQEQNSKLLDTNDKNFGSIISDDTSVNNGFNDSSIINSTLGKICDIALSKLESHLVKIEINKIAWNNHFQNDDLFNSNLKQISALSLNDLEKLLPPNLLTKMIQQKIKSKKYTMSSYASLSSIYILVLHGLAFTIKTKCMGKHILIKLFPSVTYHLFMNLYDDKFNGNEQKKVLLNLAEYHGERIKVLAQLLINECNLRHSSKKELLHLLSLMYKKNENCDSAAATLDDELVNEMNSCMNEAFFY